MKLNDQMSMVDVIKLLKAIAGDDDTMLNDIRKSLYNMAEADDLPDDSIDSWVKSYPEDKHESLRKLFAGPAVEVVKTRVEGGKDQPPADIKDSPAGEQLAENEELLSNSNSDDEYINSLIADLEEDLGAEDEPPAEELSADDKPAEDKAADEPAKDEPDTGSEEQDETTRNILAGLSDK